MYQSFFGFHEKPFSLLPDPNFLFFSKKHSAAYSLFEYTVMNESGFSVITGEVGAGKTTLIRYFLENLPQDIRVGLISNTHKSFGNLMQWICMAFDLDYRGKDKVELFHDFTDFVVNEYANRRRVLVIVDEAQNMDMETLEELRVISNINADKDQLLQTMLVGQPELRETLKRPELRQFAQRIVVDYHLDRLGPDEIEQYIKSRLKMAGGDPDIFGNDAIAAIAFHSLGIPRLINSIADMALVYAFSDEKMTVNAETVRAVVKDKTRNGISPINTGISTCVSNSGFS